MRAAVLVGVGKVTIEDRPEPDARPGWVVVRVESASLCGTDSHQYDGRIDTPFPRVPGHDFAGRVEFFIRKALERWEPRIDVKDVSVTASETKVEVDVRYAVRATNREDNVVVPFFTGEMP